MERAVFATWEQCTCRATIDGHEYLTVFDVVQTWKQLPLIAYRSADETFHVFEYDAEVAWQVCGTVGRYIADRRFELAGDHLPRAIKDEILNAMERATEQRPDLELKPFCTVHAGHPSKPARYSRRQILSWRRP